MFLCRQLKTPHLLEVVEQCIEKHSSRTYGEGEEEADAMAYLRQEVFSDSEADEAAGDMIALSDSDSDEDEAPRAVASKVAAKAVATPAELVEQAAVERRRLQFENAQRAKQSQRSQLLIKLRQKVHEAAGENYCHQSRIHTEELAVRLEVAERSRWVRSSVPLCE